MLSARPLLRSITRQESGPLVGMKPTGVDVPFRRIFFYAKFWGMFPFYFADGWKLQLSRTGLFQSFFASTLLIFSFFKSLYFSSINRLYNFIFLVELLSLILTVICSLLMLMFRYRCLSEALSAILSVQRRYGVTLRYKKYLIRIWMFSVILFVIFLLRAFEPPRSWNKTLLKIAFFLPSLMMFSSTVVFISVCLFIGDSFVIISAALLKPSLDLPEVDFLLQTHFLLVSAVESLNACYGVQNLLFFITSFFFFTSTVYTVLTGKRVSYVVMTVLFYPFMCWDIVYNCNRTKQKAKMFTEALYHSALFGKNHLLSRNMIAGATSYLLILFQFANAEIKIPIITQTNASATNYYEIKDQSYLVRSGWPVIL